MKILVTGSHGFIGKHLTKLERQNASIFPFFGDIQSFDETYKIISSNKFDVIYHLAGMSNVADCQLKPDRAYSVNVLGTFNVLESLKRLNYKTRLIFASTAHVYAPVLDSSIIDESFAVSPGNIYPFTKYCSENLIKDYFSSGTMGNAIILRLFNHTHVSQTGPFFFPQLLSQINSTLDGKVRVGNLDIFRDFSLISDLMTLFFNIEHSEINEFVATYNVCSGQVRNLKSLAEELATQLGKRIIFETDPAKLRNNEPKFVVGSNLKAKSTFNWEPRKRTDKEFIQSFLREID